MRHLLAGKPTQPVDAQAAYALKQLGVNPGDRLAVFARESFGEGGAFVARLDRARIVIQSTDTSELTTDPFAFTQLTTTLRNERIRAALHYGQPPTNSAITWQHLGQTPYYAYILLDEK